MRLRTFFTPPPQPPPPEGCGLAGYRNREPYQKVVVLTNYATPEVRRRAAKLGADAVLACCAGQTAHIFTEDVQEAQRGAVAQHDQATPT